MWGGGVLGGRDNAHVVMGLQHRKGPAAEQQNDGHDQEPDHGRASSRTGTETAR